MTGFKYRNTLLLILIFGITIVLYYLFFNSVYFQNFYNWTRTNLVLFVAVLFIVKVVALLYPPLSGGILTLGAIPFLGWPLAYAIDFIGSMIGGTMMYFLGRKYGYWLLNKLFDKKVVERVKRIKVRKNKEIEAVFVYRLLLGGTVIEIIYYGAGVLKINFWNFLVGSALSHILVGVPSFYLTGNILSGGNIFLIIVSLILLIVLFSRLKNRYFE